MCTRLFSFLALDAPAWDARRLYAPRVHLFSSARASGQAHLLWKAFLVAYSLSVSIVNADLQGGPRYMTYLTVHGVWLTVAYFIASAACAATAHWAPALAQTPAYALHARATQLLFAIALPFQLVIVTLYWLLLAQAQPSPLYVWDNLESHGLKAVLIWTDLLVGSMALPTPQLLVTLGAALIYLVINLAVTLTSYPVYSVLKWNSGASAVLVLGALVYMVLAFFLAQTLARVRDAWALQRAKRLHAGALLGAEEQDALYPLQFSDDGAAPCACSCAAARSAGGAQGSLLGDTEAQG